MDANAFDEQRHISAMVIWTTNPDLLRESESFTAGVVVQAENRRDHVGVVDGLATAAAPPGVSTRCQGQCAAVTTPPVPQPQSSPVPQPALAAGDAATPGPVAPTVSTARPPRCSTRTRQYRRGVVVDEGFPPEEMSERLAADEDTVLWLDLFDPDEADLQIVTELCRYRDYAEGSQIRVGRWRVSVVAARHSHRLSRKARILSVG